MGIQANDNILKEKEFFDKTLSDLIYQKTVVHNKVFENCTFINCDFQESTFTECRFVDCDFNICNLSATQFENSTFSQIIFYESKVIGINWTKLKWPFIKLSSPFQFYKSNISHSNFYELELKELVIEDCKAHEVDFRFADLSDANLSLTDFTQSQFMHTKLCRADLINAVNYRIDPTQNDIYKAKFSLPDAINLLRAFEIDIQE